MNTLYTSFGFNQIDLIEGNPQYFYNKMLPLNEQMKIDFLPLLISDKVFIDADVYERFNWLTEVGFFNQEDIKQINLFIKEGFIELKNYKGIYEESEDLIKKMTENDLNDYNSWLDVLYQSNKRWKEFYSKLSEYSFDSRIDPEDSWSGKIYKNGWGDLKISYPKMISPSEDRSKRESEIKEMILDGLKYKTKRKRKEYKQLLIPYLKQYLEYINSTIIISNNLNASIFDWKDILPFYEKKFLSIGNSEKLMDSKVQNLNKVFEFIFPEFDIEDSKKILKILQDKRIVEFKNYIANIDSNSKNIDQNYANSILKDILKTEYKINRFRKIVSWASLPLGFIPWVGTPIQKVVEDTFTGLKSKQLKKQYQWYFLIEEKINVV